MHPLPQTLLPHLWETTLGQREVPALRYLRLKEWILGASIDVD
jgi:hypothetical protein